MRFYNLLYLHINDHMEMDNSLDIVIGAKFNNEIIELSNGVIDDEGNGCIFVYVQNEYVTGFGLNDGGGEDLDIKLNPDEIKSIYVLLESKNIFIDNTNRVTFKQQTLPNDFLQKTKDKNYEELIRIKREITQQKDLIFKIRNTLTDAIFTKSDLIEKGQEIDDICDEIDSIEKSYFEAMKKLEALTNQKNEENQEAANFFIASLINELNKGEHSHTISDDKIKGINKSLEILEIPNRLGDKYFEEDSDDLPF